MLSDDVDFPFESLTSIQLLQRVFNTHKHILNTDLGGAWGQSCCCGIGTTGLKLNSSMTAMSHNLLEQWPE
jgi:hypothetical protein